MRYFVFLFVFFFILWRFPGQIFADTIGITVSTPVIAVRSNTPSDIKSQIIITNTADTPVTLTYTIQPFTSSDSHDGTITFLPSNAFANKSDTAFLNKLSLLDTDGITPISNILIAPSQKKKLFLSIKLPQGEPSDDYYFSILFISKNPKVDQITGSYIQAGVATNILVSINPDASQTYISQFDSPLFMQKGPVPFTIQIINKSNHFTSISGNILVTNLFGQVIGKVILAPMYLLAQDKRFMRDSSYTFLNGITWPETFLFGPYSATLTIATDNGPTYSRTIYFFAAPALFVFTMIFIVLVIIAFILRVKRKVKKIHAKQS